MVIDGLVSAETGRDGAARQRGSRVRESRATEATLATYIFMAQGWATF